ncbi:MAG TPA: hypothetical protein VFZ66_30150 [Herpetosiphonaceae bacterium]
MKYVHLSIVLVLGLLLGMGATASASRPTSPAATGTFAATTRAFTYQGRLTNGGVPANGTYDFTFILYDASVGGSQAGPIVTRNDVVVTNGLFNVTLDFGNIFVGTQYYLDIAVRPGASTGSYTQLTPRQPLTAAPYASGLVLPLDASTSTSGSAFVVDNNGSGQAAEFRSNSTFATIYASNSGTGGTFRADTGSSGQGSAITGYNYGTDRYAAELELVNSTNPRAALYARTAGNGQAIDAEVNSNTNGDAIFARTTSSSASSYAGIFVGNVSISGNLAKSSGSFKIDHPLDPANKYLYHSFVESPDMKNIYDGVVTLDDNGAAVVTMPAWFDALNQDFRYQLTAIGAPGPNLYIAKEITGTSFTIAGGTAGMKVSWQVTGIRHDAYAKAHRIPVEENKPAAERGSYIHPELYGKPASQGLDRLERPLQPAPQPEGAGQ